MTKVAASADLDDWRLDGTAIGGRPHEGPSVFELAGSWWMIVDEWRGMGVYRSDDAVAWVRQGDPDAVILGAGEVPAPASAITARPCATATRSGSTTSGIPSGRPRRQPIPSTSTTGAARFIAPV